MKHNLGPWQVEQTLTGPANLMALIPQEVHGNEIARSKELKSNRVKADGILLENSVDTVGVLTGDCLPLLLLTDRQALALHVSRKTLILGLLDEVPRFINPGEIKWIYLGPHICSKHFLFEHLGSEIVSFARKFTRAIEETNNGYHLSLRLAVQKYFQKWQVDDKVSYENKMCTYEEKTLPSYRRQGKLEQQIMTTVKRVRPSTV